MREQDDGSRARADAALLPGVLAVTKTGEAAAAQGEKECGEGWRVSAAQLYLAPEFAPFKQCPNVMALADGGLPGWSGSNVQCQRAAGHGPEPAPATWPPTIEGEPVVCIPWPRIKDAKAQMKAEFAAIACPHGNPPEWCGCEEPA